MLKISKLTDYAIILLCELKEDNLLSAKELSDKTKIPLATTNKILKKLLTANICQSTSGRYGGFSLAIPHNKISISKVISAIEESETHFTECSHTTSTCQLIGHCKISSKMNAIDLEINHILSNRFISNLI